jgi:hypothetical protein
MKMSDEQRQTLIEYYEALNGKKFITSDKGQELEDDKVITVKEALSTADANVLIPRTISTIMMEAAEPEYLASRFLQRIELTQGNSMEFINFGAIRAFDIPEGSAYPEQSLDLTKFGAATTNVRISKVGLKVAITEELVNDSRWDVIAMHLRAAGRAMARKKEEKAFQAFSQHGHIVFDGDDTDGALQPSGRGFDGTKNGTLTAEDFIAMCTSIMAMGFNPTDVIMHPLCWALFAKNQFINDLMGAAAFGGGVSGKSLDAGEPPRKSYLGGSVNFNLPVQGLALSFSPWVPFDEVNKKFDVFILDRNNVGVILVKDDMTTEQFVDPEKDIYNLKVKERYGIGILNGGYGIAVAKNIAFKKTWTMPERHFAAIDMPADMTNEEMDVL